MRIKEGHPKMRGSLASWNAFCQNATSPHCTNTPVVLMRPSLQGATGILWRFLQEGVIQSTTKKLLAAHFAQ